MKLLYEQMIRFEAANKVCRVWREVEPSDIGKEADKSFENTAYEMMYAGHAPYKIVSVLVKFDRVNSVEVIDKSTGNGLCVHKDWP